MTGRKRGVFPQFSKFPKKTFDSRARRAYNPSIIGDSQLGKDGIMADKVKVDVWFDYA